MKMKKTFKSIKDLHEACKSGKVDESKLKIVLDNDNTHFYFVRNWEDDDVDELNVKGAGGYEDIDLLYDLLFPKAEVDWC